PHQPGDATSDEFTPGVSRADGERRGSTHGACVGLQGGSEGCLNLLVVHGNAVARLADCELKFRYILDRREERVGSWIVKRPQVGLSILERVSRWARQLTVQLLEMIVLSLRVPDLEL